MITGAMVKVHDHVYTHSIFYIHSQLEEYRNRIYTWSSCIYQLKQSIFTLGLEYLTIRQYFLLIHKTRSHHATNKVRE